MEENLQKIIELISNLSPDTWNILLLQARNEAYLDLVWYTLFALAFLMLAYFTKQAYKTSTYYDLEETSVSEKITEFVFDGGWLFVIFLSVSAYASIHMLASAIMWFNNPEFYAIRWLLAQIQ